MSASPHAIVVGAGPVGMTAALALRALNVPTTLLEAEPADRVRPGSRALFLHRESLARLDRIAPGLGREIADHGIMWPVRRTLYRGRQVFRRADPPPPAGKLPPFTSLRQVDTERHLLAACERAGTEIVWGAEVDAIESSSAGVELHTRDGRSLSAPYVVAADGSRSAVRGALGVPMEGRRSDHFHVVVDLEDDPDRPRPLERVFHYEHPAIGDRNVLLVPFAGGWQVDLQCRDGDRPEDFVDDVAAWLPQVIEERYAERVLWVSTYHFNEKVAESFVDPQRRVLLAGEAAHLFAPFGARGLNSGIADAYAAAEAVEVALAAGHAARAAAAAEAYDAMRRRAAQFNRSAAAAALAHMRPRRVRARLARRGAAALAPFVPALGRWLEQAPYGPRGAPGLALGAGRY